MTTAFRGHFDGTFIVPEQPLDLPVGRSVEFRIEEIPTPPIANAKVAALFAGVKAGPRVTKEDTAELQRLIAEGRTPAIPGGQFDEPGER